MSGSLSRYPKEAKPIVLYDGEWGIALKPMQGNWSSSQANLGYTELFHIPVVTSVSFQACEGLLGDARSVVKQIKAPFLFDWKQGTALHAVQWNRASSLSEVEVSWFFSSCGGNLGYILELRQG